MTDMEQRYINTLILVISAYVAAQILADIASLRIVMVGGLSMDAGTLVYPFTFTLRDLVHKVAGKQAARVIILSAAGINLLMAFLFQTVAALAPDLAVGAQYEFALVLAPVWRIVIASIVAEVVAELLDTEVYHRVRARLGDRYQWARVLISNAVSVPLDSVLFAMIAFYGDLPTSVVIGIIGANIAIKGAVTVLSLPAIYMVPKGVSYAAAARRHG